GVRSAMPMFKARRLCPDAVVLKPDMAKYVAVSREIQARMRALTPLVEPLSLDEAFLDLRGSERLHRGAPAETLARFVRAVEQDVGVTLSAGLAPNKFLAKIASELDKPRGFSVIGAAEAVAFLEEKPVGLIWGVGARLEERLRRDGFRRIGDLRAADPARLRALYGSIGMRLAALSRGEDARPVVADAKRKSVSAETTFSEDLSALDDLDAELWRLAEEVSARLKAAGLAGAVVVLKLKTAAFQTLTRRLTLDAPTALADALYRAARPMLVREIAGGRAYRLLGLGVGGLAAGEGAAPAGDLFDPGARRRAEAERAMDAIRDRFGAGAIGKGRGRAPRRGG
ncbi:MAG: DNA polymerase IV, partial [Pseudomonadota bacterium]